jgi:hypothetical protein
MLRSVNTLNTWDISIYVEIHAIDTLHTEALGFYNYLRNGKSIPEVDTSKMSSSSSEQALVSRTAISLESEI